MTLDRLEQRLEELDRRLSRLEREVLKTAPVPPVTTAASAPAAPPTSQARPLQRTFDPAETVAKKAAVVAAMRERAVAREERGSSEQEAAWSFERLLGGRAFAALGALGIVIGMGFFVKLAYDEGWIRLSPAMRCVGAAAFGAALLGVGVWSRRRLASWAVAGLMSAGLGVMYGAGFAAFTLYDLLGPALALGTLALVSAIGAALGSRTRLAVVALLSLIAAYAAPLVVASEADAPYAMPPYLLAVYAAGLWMSRRGGPWFDAARTVAWWGLAVLGAVWTLVESSELPWYALGFLTLGVGVTHVDLLLRARRLDAHDCAGHEGFEFDRPRGRIALACFATLGWGAVLGVQALVQSGAAPEWMWPAGLAAAALIAGFVLAGHLRFRHDIVHDARETLGATLLAGAGCAAGYALTLALAGWTEVFAWLGVGVGAAIAGTWARARPLHVYALGALVLGSSGGLFLAHMTPGVTTEWMGLEWSRGTWALLGAAAAWAIVARLIAIGAGASWLSVANVALAAGAGIAARAVSLGSPEPRSLAVASLVLGLIFALWGAADRRLIVRLVALLYCGAAACAWAVEVVDTSWMREGGIVLGLRPMLWLALAIAVCTVAIGLWIRRRPAAPVEVGDTCLVFGRGGVVVGALLTLAATSLEAARLAALFTSDTTARAAAVSLWWGVFGLGMLLTGLMVRSRAVRISALGLILIAAAKAAILDLADVAPAWRVASFVGLGLLMLAVAIGYSRMAKRKPVEDSVSAEG